MTASATAAFPDSLRVLLVEDTDYMRDLVTRMLKKIGVATTETASSGNEAIQKATRENFDLVLCDVGLPDIGGFEVVRAIRCARPALPCLMLTGQTDRESVLAARALGVAAYLVKPVSPRELEAKLRAVLARRPG
jgi:DNA-binding response OmpR family regulator